MVQCSAQALIALLALTASLAAAQAPGVIPTPADASLIPDPVAAAAGAAVVTPQVAASRSRACNSCPSGVSPVCAEAAGISITVASRCLAECQQLANIRAGSCEDLAASK